MKLSVATLLQATNARVVRVTDQGEAVPGALSPADLERVFSDVVIDSRSVSPDTLFVCLQGERRDGHAFIEQALQSGALGCLVARIPDPEVLTAGWSDSVTPGAPQSRWPAGPRGPFLFVVPDPLSALQQLANYWRRRHDVEVIGITGSIGKTTAKEILSAVLSTRWPVLRSEANLNTEIGLPLTLLRLAPEHQVAVLEMGMYAPGDIMLLAQIAEPRIGVVTNIAPIHLERMRTIRRIARAKSELVAALLPTGLAVLNGDDPWTRAMAQTSGLAPTVLVGLSSDCDYRAVDVTAHGLDGISFSIAAEGRKTFVRTHVPGVHTLHALLAAAAVGRALKMTWDELQEAMSLLRIDARQRVLHGPENLLIIDDSYNAAPLSMNAALDLLAAAPGRKIAVLGDMLELGPQEAEAHRQVGERASEVADWLVVRGPRSQWIAEGAENRGFPPERIRRAASNADVVDTVRSIVLGAENTNQTRLAHTMQRARPDATVSREPSASDSDVTDAGSLPTTAWSVLVKGSRGMRMEEVVEGLRGER